MARQGGGCEGRESVNLHEKQKKQTKNVHLSLTPLFMYRA